MYSKSSLLTVIFSLSMLSLFGQLHLDWALNYGGKISDGGGQSLIDRENNLYVLDFFRDTADIDPGPGVEIVTPLNQFFYTLIKFDEDGNFVYGYPFYDGESLSAVLLDISDNSLHAAITYHDSLVYVQEGQNHLLYKKPGLHTALLTLSLSGDVTDSYDFETPGQLYFSSWIPLPDGKIILAGSFYDSIYFGQNETFHYTSLGKSDAFIELLDSDYQTEWVSVFGSKDYDDFEKVVLKNNSIYFAGEFKDSLHVVLPSGAEVIPTQGEGDGMFGRINLYGDIEQLNTFGGAGDEEMRGLGVDDDGNMLICGYFEETVNFASPQQSVHWMTAWGESDGFVSKYDPNGDLLWTRIYASSGYSGLYTLDLKRENEIYLSGGMTLIGDLDPGPDSIHFEAGYRGHNIITKLTLDGDLKWSYDFPSPDFAGIRNVNVNTEKSTVYLSGYFSTQMDCDVSADSSLIISNGQNDAFIIKFSEDNVVTGTSNLQQGELHVYPNPATDQINIETKDALHVIRIFNGTGTLVRQTDKLSGSHEAINLSGLPAGMYFLDIQYADHQETSKIIKQ